MARQLLLFASRYDFKTDDGTQLTGCKLTYADTIDQTSNQQGWGLITLSAPYSVWGELQAVPGFYDVETSAKMKAIDGVMRAIVIFKGIKFLSPLGNKPLAENQ
jgi:hypothetical protein